MEQQHDHRALNVSASPPLRKALLRGRLPTLSNASGVRVAAVGIASAGTLAVLRFGDPTRGGFPRCAVHAATGLWCPGCGSQRSLHALLHGDVVGALGYNALVVLALPVLVYAYVAWAGRVFARAGWPPVRLPTTLARVLPAVVVAFMFARNLPGGATLAP